MAERMILVPVRTSRQGTSLNAGKLKKEYRDETSTVEIQSEDMKRLGLKKGDKIRLRSMAGFEIVVSCKEKKGGENTPGLIFMAYGPQSSELMEADTAGTGMPASKHIEVDLEGPLAEDGSQLPPDQAPPVGAQTDTGAIPDFSSPLSQQQAELVNSLMASSLNPMQMAWLSGFFAGRGAAPGGAPVDFSAQPAGQAAAASALPRMTILFGSQTGNGEGLAHQLGEQAKARGFNVAAVDMNDYEPANLTKEQILYVIVSTHGEGDPPDAAHALHSFLQSDEAPRLEQLQYAVFALGDSSYEQYCQTGKDFDTFLAALGAKPLLERVDADVDFEEPAEEWIAQVLDSYQSIAGETAEQPGAGAAAPPKAKKGYSKTNPFPAPVLRNINLSGEGSIKETRHIEIDLADSGLTYEPGDALGVYPKNNPVYVEELLAALKMDGSEQVTVAKQTLPLREAFTEKLDITALSRLLVDKYADLTGNEDLKVLLDDDHKDDLKDYMWGRQLVDLVEDSPPEGVSAEAFAKILRKMPGRLYSIASSLKAHENQVHLLVAAVRYHSHDRDREGVCSTFLAGRLQPDEKLPIYVQQNKNFRPPADDARMIMVGPGTGVAPFRAFLEERRADGATGKNWLFFGDQHRACDYLYGDEWEAMHKDGFLTRLDLAFSRDQEHKIYVQHRITENGKELYAWLEEGAYFYVCGDAEYMAKDVHKALLGLIAQEGGKTEEQAEEYLQTMQAQKRYQRDVY
jgi:sulfite reductase (NADPH) flavoprotein alpha-component